MSVKAKKMFGQNFLKDSSVLHRIIQSMPENSTNELIEIGPGLGDLTQWLLQKRGVVAYEVDRDLCAYLNERFAKERKAKDFTLHQGDVLAIWDQQGSLSATRYDVVANLPYYIATAIILRALNDTQCQSLRVMVQREVAQKFAAKPKEKNFGSLGILAHTLGTVEILFDVPPSAFEPPPKVVSSVLWIQKQREFVGENGVFENGQMHHAFEQYLKTAFCAPRKRWLKNLSSQYDKTLLASLLETHSLSLDVRAHEIDTATHHHLFKQLTKVNDYVRNEQQQQQRLQQQP
ncbi:MAG: 16S rRNA (adenine(1518)-N(6)/adenine(1519)-N(6))-dimethyltransferase RsmA [Campylobacterales bacterium]|nr:16S rRNA (adenine(1518)-N(6)/adenine(1519)-N(6))-dimethyltransferase RsmA [Campylobacterales bacterium]